MDQREPAPVCFLDTETLGLDADVHPVWEVGIVTPNGDEHLWQCKLTDRQISLAHPKALEISGFTERYDHASALGPAVFASRVRDVTTGMHLAGAVISFDEERLRRLMWAWDFVPAWHYHLIDVEALVAGQFGIDPPWGSDTLAAMVGVTITDEDRHTALGDARWAKRIYDAVMLEARKWANA